MVSNLMFPMSLKVLYTNKIWKNNDFTLLALMLINFYKNFGYFIVFLKKHCCNFFYFSGFKKHWCGQCLHHCRQISTSPRKCV